MTDEQRLAPGDYRVTVELGYTPLTWEWRVSTPRNLWFGTSLTRWSARRAALREIRRQDRAARRRAEAAADPRNTWTVRGDIAAMGPSPAPATRGSREGAR